jgi:hypothetical protein
LIASGYQPVTLDSYLSGKVDAKQNKIVLIRHDVDRWLRTALRMAEVEAQMGIAASYYFRVPSTWNESVSRRVVELGHEVGLHYEVLDKAKGNKEKASEHMVRDLETARKIAPITTAAMHGNPATPYDNRNFWEANQFADFGLIGEAYLSVEFDDFHYFSDTGRSWKDNYFNIYDAPATEKNKKKSLRLNNTDELIGAVKGLEKNLYLVTHPERWSANIFEWSFSWTKDLVANRLKYVIQHVLFSSNENQ